MNMMFDKIGCTVIVAGVEYKDKAIGCFNGTTFMYVNGERNRVEQIGFAFTTEEKSFLQAKAKEMIRKSREAQRNA